MGTKKFIITVICLFCLTGCRTPSHIGNSLKRDYSDPEKYFYLSAAISRKYHKWPDWEKQKLLAESRFYDDDNFQALRFLCWVVEDDASLRKLLLKQWLTIHKDHDTLAPIDEVLPRISEIISTDTTENQQKRLSEFKKAYAKAHGRKRQSKYIHDFKQKNIILITTPIIDHQEPMGLTIFSRDTKKVMDSIQECEAKDHMHIVVKSIHRGGPDEFIPTELISVVIYNALDKIGSGMNKSMAKNQPVEPR